MKKTAIIIALIFSSFVGISQTKIVRDANGNFVTQKAPKKASEDKPTGQTFTTSKGEEFPVYVSEKGSTIARLKLKGIDGAPHKQRSMRLNSTQREEPYQGLTYRDWETDRKSVV